MKLRWIGPWAVGCLCALPGFGQARVLTIDEAWTLARERAVNVVLARGRIEEARARQIQAGRCFQDDPVLEVEGGVRKAEDDDYRELEASLTQDLYAGKRRAARLAATQASLERAEAELGEARRLLQRDVWTAFVRLQVAQDRVDLLARSRQSADELLSATERRYEAGETTALEMNRARVAAASARTGQEAAQAEASTALAELQALLGLPPGEAVEVQPLSTPKPGELEALLASVAERPDLQALAAELREAEADVLLGRSLARPAWGIRGSVAREEGADVVTAGVVVSLPVHHRGQEAVAVGQARAAALRQALETSRAAAEAAVRGLHSALSRQLAAVRELETTALPALKDNESLALKSFEAGEIDLGDLLQIRREIAETYLAYLDRRLEATLTGFELEAAAGVLP